MAGAAIANPVSTNPPAAKVAIGDGARLQITIHWILRVGVAMCFIGHGAFGFIQKKGWLAFTDVVGMPRELAWNIQPLIGAMDVCIGILTLFWPLRGVLAYGAFWCLWTAMLRPLADKGIMEFFERGGNYGVCLGLLLIAGWTTDWKRLFTEKALPALTPERAQTAAWVMRICVCALMVGHGGLLASGPTGFTDTPWHLDHWTHVFNGLGLSLSESSAIALMRGIGLAEIAIGFAVLLKPSAPLLWFIVIWKIFTEALRMPAHEPHWGFEWLERGGSYLVPLALIFLYQWIARFGYVRARATT